MIYIAAAYSDDEAIIRQARFEIVLQYQRGMMMAERLAISPVVMTHEMARQYNIPTEYTIWKEYCEGILSKCDAMHVLTFYGWRSSKGVAAEIEYANAHDIPITYIPMDDAS